MNDDRWRKIKEIFAGASGRQGAERESYLAHACGGDADLRSLVESLLTGELINPPAIDGAAPSPPALTHQGAAPPDSNRPHPPTSARGSDQPAKPDGHSTDSVVRKPPAEQPGTRVGKYKLLERIGEGSFGEVWVAEQERPVRRKVAVKIVKAGMDTREVLARFEAERQALAVMDHPNVARVFDAGATDSGRPFFVMEHVPGVPITSYCDSARLKIQDRLNLFVDICNAVQHAHHKGVIHRDLKPGNILVTINDGKPVPKVIDFGIAKAAIGRLTERSLYTEMGRLIGTPEYMAPEQAGTSGLDVDTRADIYSLGVLLYQLLTGTLPFDTATLREAGYDGIAKIIREQEPPKPSTRLSTLATEPVTRTTAATPGATPDAIARSHDTDIRTLQRALRGDLDWIVMKAMEKDRGRRYETANAFAADVRRHLTGEPVVAAPPSVAYRVKKFVRKHKGQVVAVSMVAIVLIGGIIATTSQWKRADAKADEARAAKQKTEELLDQAKEGLWRLAQEADTHQTAFSQYRKQQVFGIGPIEITRQAIPSDPIDSLILEGLAAIQESKKQRDEAQLEAYIARISAAQTAMSAHNWPEARELLDACPEDKRGWEWNLLRQKAETILWSLPDGVNGAEFSPDSKFVLLTSGSQAWVVDAATGKQIGDTMQHEDDVYDAGFSPDGSYVLTASKNTVQAWDTITGRPIRTAMLTGHESDEYTDMYATVFSHDCLHLLKVFTNDSVRQFAQLWNLKTAGLIGTPLDLGVRGYFKDEYVQFSRDDRLVAICGYGSNSVHVLDVMTGSRISRIQLDTQCDSVKFSSDHSRLLISDYEIVGLWDTATSKKLSSIRPDFASEEVSAVFNHKGSRILTTSYTTARLWDVDTGQPLHLMSGESKIYDGRFSPDDKYILTTSCYDGIAQLWDPVGHPVARMELPSEDLNDDAIFDDRAFASVFSNDGKYAMIILGGPAYLVSMDRFNWPEWGVNGDVDLEIAAMMDERSSRVTTNQAASETEPRPSALYIAGRSQESESGHLANEKTRTHEQSPLPHGRGSEKPRLGSDQGNDDDSVISPDGNRRVAVKKDGSIRLYDTASNRETVVIRGTRPKKLQFTHDGTRLILRFEGGNALVWDTRDPAARQADRDARFAEREPANVYVNNLLGGQTPWDSLKQSVRDNKDLTPLRCAVVMEVLCECMARFRYEAGTIIEAIKKEFITPARVQSAVEHWVPDVEAKAQSISNNHDDVDFHRRRLHEALRELARDWKPNADELYELAWEAVESASAPPERVEAALDAAREAAKLNPRDGDFAFTLGTALYRHGDYSDALATWEHAYKLGVSATKEGNESRAAFRSMAMHQLGRHEEARAYLNELKNSLNYYYRIEGAFIDRRFAFQSNEDDSFGTGILDLSADGQSFSGRRRNDGDSADEERDWKGKRTTGEDPDRFDGFWDTNHGTMWLFTDGDKVRGYYGIEPCVAEAVMMIEGAAPGASTTPSTTSQPNTTQSAASQPATTQPVEIDSGGGS